MAPSALLFLLDIVSSLGFSVVESSLVTDSLQRAGVVSFMIGWLAADRYGVSE